MKVHILTIDTPYGVDVNVYTDVLMARKDLYMYVESVWGEHFPDEVMPLNEEDAIDYYTRCAVSDFIYVRSCDVIDHERDMVY